LAGAIQPITRPSVDFIGMRKPDVSGYPMFTAVD